MLNPRIICGLNSFFVVVEFRKYFHKIVLGKNLVSVWNWKMCSDSTARHNRRRSERWLSGRVRMEGVWEVLGEVCYSEVNWKISEIFQTNNSWLFPVLSGGDPLPHSGQNEVIALHFFF